MRVLGYVRVSTDEQTDSGAGLEAQRRAIIAECERRGWHLVEVIEDAGFSAKDLKRPGIQEALRVLEAGDANGARRREARPALALDDRLHGADGDGAEAGLGARRARLRGRYDDPAGEAMANMLATFAQFERRLISQRTREALAVKRAKGVRLGRPVSLPQKVARRIQRRRERGDSLRKIADDLNRDGVATAQEGKQWHASTVRHVLKRLEH